MHNCLLNCGFFSFSIFCDVPLEIAARFFFKRSYISLMSKKRTGVLCFRRKSIKENKAGSYVCFLASLFDLIKWTVAVRMHQVRLLQEVPWGLNWNLARVPCACRSEHGLFCIAITIATLAATREFWGRTVILMDCK